MRVLFCGDVAGVSSIIHRHMSMAYDDHDGVVVHNGTYDPYRICDMYPERVTVQGVTPTYVALARRAWRRDVLHVCGGIRYIGLLRAISRGGVILHYHGSDARDIPADVRRPTERHADRIVVSTPDLLGCAYAREPTYLPNPVDTALFRPLRRTSNSRGLVMLKPGQGREATKKRLADLGYGDIDWDLAARSYDMGAVRGAQGLATDGGVTRIMYLHMPILLSQYEYYGEVYWDAAHRDWYTADSTTGLQAAAMGLRVVRHDGSVMDRLPPEHEPARVAATVRSIYDALLA